jgi:hypothetical protein
MSLLIGCDPEVFFQHKHTGLPISVIDKLGGTKDKYLAISPDGHGVLEDNCAAEFNIPPAAELREFLGSVKYCIEYLQTVANKHDAELSVKASVQMPDTELEDPRAWQFGCEPDFDAYTGEINPRPYCDDVTLRSAGGHIHVGFKKGATKDEQENVIRCLDFIVGIPSVMYDTDTKRRLLYGKPGAYRPKPYGVEYRTPSNFWLFDINYASWIFEATRRAVTFAQDNYLDPKSELCAEVQEIINTSDTYRAQHMIGSHNVHLVI